MNPLLHNCKSVIQVAADTVEELIDNLQEFKESYGALQTNPLRLKLIEETLSDGSIAYSVQISERD